jgi:sulfite exporter TauE/SafE
MTLTIEYPMLWLTAFMTGLLGSGHCFAMCGGSASSLGTLNLQGKNQQSRAAVFIQALQFNLGRIAGYGLAGGVAAGLVGVIPAISGLEMIATGLRLITAILVGLIGLRYLFDWNGLNRIERLGARLWPGIAPLAARLARSPGSSSRILLGVCWGFLPCGLVYTLLLTAASTAHVLLGATVMIAFGLGTIPSMLGLTLAAPSLAAILKDKDFRRFIGLSLAILAAWMAFTALTMGKNHSAHHHVMLDAQLSYPHAMMNGASAELDDW